MEQLASPYPLGKEFLVFVERLDEQSAELSKIAWRGKFGGATGNFNATMWPTHLRLGCLRERLSELAPWPGLFTAHDPKESII